MKYNQCTHETSPSNHNSSKNIERETKEQILSTRNKYTCSPCPSAVFHLVWTGHHMCMRVLTTTPAALQSPPLSSVRGVRCYEPRCSQQCHHSSVFCLLQPARPPSGACSAKSLPIQWTMPSPSLSLCSAPAVISAGSKPSLTAQRDPGLRTPNRHLFSGFFQVTRALTCILKFSDVTVPWAMPYSVGGWYDKIYSRRFSVTYIVMRKFKLFFVY